MKLITLNSGSNGNAIYLESDDGNSAIMLDCGISRLQIEARLKVHGRAPHADLPVFITHEHGDHVRGLASLSKTYHMRSYMTEATYRKLYARPEVKGFRFMGNTETVEHGAFRVTAFPKKHDAADPVGFLVESDGARFLYLTDLGEENPEALALLPTADGMLIESNYDLDMLLAGDYPQWLKLRVQSDVGHLSNERAALLVKQHTGGMLRTLVLGHLSANNNTPECAETAMRAALANRNGTSPALHVASRHNVGDIIEV